METSRLLLLAGGLVLTAWLSAEVQLICHEARQNISIPRCLQICRLGWTPNASRGQYHTFDTSSLRRLKVFESLND